MHDDLILTHATLNITFSAMNGDLKDPVSLDATDAQIRAWAEEALRSGDVPGVGKHPNADLSDFVIERFPPADEIKHHRIFVRPKTAFGAADPHSKERTIDALLNSAFGV